VAAPVASEALLQRPAERAGMDIDAEMRRKIAVSILSVGAFFALFVGIGVTFGPDLGETGGMALVAAIALFVVGMGAVGVFLND
jgi:hypothetical protein